MSVLFIDVGVRAYDHLEAFVDSVRALTGSQFPLPELRTENEQLAQRKLWPPPRRSMAWRGIDHPWPSRPLHTLDLG